MRTAAVRQKAVKVGNRRVSNPSPQKAALWRAHGGVLRSMPAERRGVSKHFALPLNATTDMVALKINKITHAAARRVGSTSRRPAPPPDKCRWSVYPGTEDIHQR